MSSRRLVSRHEHSSDVKPVRSKTYVRRFTNRRSFLDDDDLPNVAAEGVPLTTIDETSHDDKDDVLLSKSFIGAFIVS